VSRVGSAAAFAGGVAVDTVIGDPGGRAHPVAALGSLIRLLERRAPARPAARRAYGVAAAVALPAAALIAAQGVERGAGGGARRIAADAMLLGFASSLRTLVARGREVEEALEANDLPRARSLVGQHLVSRDVEELSASEAGGAAISSVAENLSDAVIAPWLAFAAGGAPLAWAYRASNTLDAMWGYRSERYRELGWAAARLDDGWNLLPSRLTAAVICAAAELRGARGAECLAAWRRDGSSTDSPNAGQPMAAMAGALGVELTKPGHYALARGERPPSAADLGEAIAIARLAAVLAGGALGLLVLARGLPR
jgi:adenosylcobinamide-phosphate synthase